MKLSCQVAAQQGGYLAELLGKGIATGDEVRRGERSGEIPTGCGLLVGGKLILLMSFGWLIFFLVEAWRRCHVFFLVG